MRLYGYNGRGQLYSESDGDPGAQNWFFYRFDSELDLTVPPMGIGLGVRTESARINAGDTNFDPGLWFVQTAYDAFQRPQWESQNLPGQPYDGTKELFTTYDGEGNEVWRSSFTGTQRALSWDGFKRLTQVEQRTDGTWLTGFRWGAIYDGFGRRIRTEQQAISSGTLSGPVTIIDSYYDPEVEFLELGAR